MKASIALPIAQAICRSLSPYCEVIKIAGSIRRLQDEVKDIELVAVPIKTLQPVPVTLFQEMMASTGEAKYITHEEYVKEVNNLGKILKGKHGGRYMQIELPEGINLDLFTPEEHDYYRQLAIRTGSALYSEKVIAGGWRKIGWVGTKDGLRKQSDCEHKVLPSGTSWICTNKNPELPPVWKSEKEFFEWIKVTYVEPIKRNI